MFVLHHVIWSLECFFFLDGRFVLDEKLHKLEFPSRKSSSTVFSEFFENGEESKLSGI